MFNVLGCHRVRVSEKDWNGYQSVASRNSFDKLI